MDTMAARNPGMAEGQFGPIREPIDEVTEYEEATFRAVTDGTADYQSMQDTIRRHGRTAHDYGGLE